MKRGLVFSLCTLAVASLASSAMAQNVQLSLNLRYTDPADPSEGGSWYLVAKTDDADGVAGISAYLNNINETPMGYGTAGAVDTRYTAVTAAQLAALENGGQPYKTTTNGAVNVVYGQDISSPGGTIVTGVGTAGFAQATANDPLKNATWNAATLIANGTFGGTRPTIATNVGTAMNNTDANTLAGATLGVAAQPAATTITVRGDTLRSLGLNTPANAGLLRGDTDRDFDIDSDDLNNVLFSFNQTGKTWGQGDVTDGLGGHVEGEVNSDDLNQILFSFNQSSATPPPAVSAIPEPATLGLLALAFTGILASARRRSL